MPIQDQVGRGDDDQVRRIRALEQGHQAILALAGSAKAIAAAVQTGLGNLATSGTTWAGPVASPGTISSAGNATVGGSANVSGNINLTGDLYTPHGRATPVVNSYVAAYLNVDGRLGATPSALRYKQDVEPADMSAYVEALRRVALVRFRYIAAVEELGDSAPVEIGSIAEYFVAAGLSEWVYFDEAGAPQGINYERLTIPLIAAFQSLDERVRKLES